MKKKITLCMVLSTFIICAMLCLTNCSNDDAPTSVFTPEALKQTTWQAQMTYQVNGKIITFDNIAGPWTVLEYTGTHLVMEAYNPNKMVWTLEKMY